MIKWTNVNVSKGEDENVKVISHERIEDTNPDTYVERGKAFFSKGRYKEAEIEYLKAVKFSNKDREYVMTLIQFYYATDSKEYTKKADRLYKDYNKELKYTQICIISLCLLQAGLSGMSLIWLLTYIPFLLSGVVYVSNPKVGFIHKARNQNFKYIIEIIFSGIVFFIMEAGMIISIYNGGKLYDNIFDLQEKPIILYGGIVVGIIALVKGIINFNKIISEKQKNVRKNGLLHKISKAARVAGSAAAVLYSIFLVSNIDFDQINNKNKFDTISGKKDKYDDNYYFDGDNDFMYDEEDYYDNNYAASEEDDMDDQSVTNDIYNDEQGEMSESDNAFINNAEDEVTDETENKAYWSIDLEVIYNELTESGNIDDLEKKMGQKAYKKADYVSSTCNDLRAKVGNVTGTLSYWENKDDRNMCSWTSSEPVTENELIKMLDVNPTSEIIDDQQVFIWHDRLELVVSYGQMSTYIGFNVLS